jgi:hypothetical protein
MFRNMLTTGFKETDADDITVTVPFAPYDDVWDLLTFGPLLTADVITLPVLQQLGRMYHYFLCDERLEELRAVVAARILSPITATGDFVALYRMWEGVEGGNLVDFPNLFTLDSDVTTVDRAIQFIVDLDLGMEANVGDTAVEDRLQMLSALYAAFGHNPRFQAHAGVNLEHAAPALASVPCNISTTDPLGIASQYAPSAQNLVPSLDLFKQRFAAFTDGLFLPHFPWDSVVAAGGAIHACMDLTVHTGRFNTVLRGADVDLWMYGYASIAEAIEWCEPVFEYFDSLGALYSYAAPSVVTIVVPGASRNVQLIFDGSDNPLGVCMRFDFAYVNSYYDGTTVRSSPHCLQEIRSKVILTDCKISSARIVKAVYRGFGFQHSPLGEATVESLRSTPHVARSLNKYYHMALNETPDHAVHLMQLVFTCPAVCSSAELVPLIVAGGASMQNSFAEYAEGAEMMASHLWTLDRDMERITTFSLESPTAQRMEWHHVGDAGSTIKCAPLFTMSTGFVFLPFNLELGSVYDRNEDQRGSEVKVAGPTSTGKVLVNHPVATGASVVALNKNWGFMGERFVTLLVQYYSYNVKITRNTKVVSGTTGLPLLCLPAAVSARLHLVAYVLKPLRGAPRRRLERPLTAGKLLLVASKVEVFPRHTCRNSL